MVFEKAAGFSCSLFFMPGGWPLGLIVVMVGT